MNLMRGGFLVSVPPFDALLMALATFRITRLIVYDKITRWFRELFADSREFTEGGVTYVEIKPFGSGFRHTIHDLLECPWCIGIWSALVVVFFYFIYPWAWSIIFFLCSPAQGRLSRFGQTAWDGKLKTSNSIRLKENPAERAPTARGFRFLELHRDIQFFLSRGIPRRVIIF